MKQGITCNGNNDKRNVGIITFFFKRNLTLKKVVVCEVDSF